MTNAIEEKLSFFKKEILPLCVSAETSNNPDTWKDSNPMAGHCAIVSLFLHNAVGAEIYRCTPILPNGKEDSHYLNKVDGKIADMTGEQYGVFEMGGDQVFFSNLQPRTADYLLSNESTKQRYGIFEQRVRAIMALKKFSFAA